MLRRKGTGWLYSPRIREGKFSETPIHLGATLPNRIGERGTSPSAVKYRRPFRKGRDRNGCAVWRAGAWSSGLRPVSGARVGRSNHGRARVAEAPGGPVGFRPGARRVGCPLAGAHGVRGDTFAE